MFCSNHYTISNKDKRYYLTTKIFNTNKLQTLPRDSEGILWPRFLSCTFFSVYNTGEKATGVFKPFVSIHDFACWMESTIWHRWETVTGRNLI